MPSSIFQNMKTEAACKNPQWFIPLPASVSLTAPNFESEFRSAALFDTSGVVAAGLLENCEVKSVLL